MKWNPSFFKPTVIVKCLMGISIQLLMLSCGSTKPELTSQWKNDMIKAEPLSNDGFVTFPNTKIIVKTFNNTESIGVIIKVTDESIQPKLLMNGLTVWIDTTGRKKEQIGIVFPSGFSEKKPSGVPGKRGAKPDNGPKGMDIAGLVQTVNMAGAEIKKGEQQISVDSEIASVYYDSLRFLTYKITIPINMLNSKGLYSKVISIGILSETKTPDQQGGEAGQRGGGMGGPPSGGGGMDGGNGGGMGGPPSGGRPDGNSGPSSDTEDKEIKSWLAFSLASNPQK